MVPKQQIGLDYTYRLFLQVHPPVRKTSIGAHVVGGEALRSLGGDVLDASGDES